MYHHCMIGAAILIIRSKRNNMVTLWVCVLNFDNIHLNSYVLSEYIICIITTQLICGFGCENIHANQDLRTHRYSSPGTKKAVKNNVLFSFVSVTQ
jgi:hypothetical protein